MTTTELKEFIRKRDEAINKAVEGLEKDIAALQRRLFNELTEQLLTRLRTDDGKLNQSVENSRALNGLEELIKQFNKQFSEPLIKDMADKMVKILELSDEAYQKGYNVSDATFAAMKQSTDYIYESIGVTRNGQIIPGGYLSRLAEMPEVQSQVYNYVRNNVVNGAGITQFQKGFKELIMGTPEVPGAVMRYHQQYSFDTFNKVDAAINEVFSAELGLEYFIYSGTVIETTRCFCEKRANKVFRKSDAAKWKNDPTLLKGYKTGKYPYNPLIDRGGFNCRHEISYISKALAEKLGYSEAEANRINEATCD